MRRPITADLFLFQYLLLLITLFSPSIAGGTLTTNQPLADDGGNLVSPGGSFALGFFSPTGSTKRYIGVWYNKITEMTVVWVANRQQPLADDRRGTLSLLSNGTLVIRDENLTAVWSSSISSALRNPVAQLLDDGNFVVGEAGMNTSDPNSFAWQSFDFPTNTLLPGMKLGWNLTTRFNRQLSSWKSESDPAPGQFTFGVNLDGDPQIFEWSGGNEAWRAGPWNGLRFTGVPQMQTYNMFSLQFFITDVEVAYTFHMLDPSFISRLVVNSTGTLNRVVWIDQYKYWNAFWIAPMDQCDVISPCGTFGVCDTSGSPMLCSCLQGFRPNNPENWDLRAGIDGCARKTALDCRNGTDGFVLVSGVKLPDTSSAVVDWGMSMEECRRVCLKNCSCTAYARANISGSGSGCIAWYANLTDLRLYGKGGQDLYVRLAAADLGKESNRWSSARVAVTVVVISLVAFFLAAVAYRAWKRKQRRLQNMPSAISFRDQDNIDAENDSKNLELPLFDLETVIDATDDFSIENKLGEGGFGPVYKGKLGEQEVAVKRLSKTSIQGLDEFKNEIVLIAKLQHRNLVQLLGCCVQGEERILIYEYLPNSSLDSFLFDKDRRVVLNWQARSNIILGIARGLLYLHQDSRLKIIHRDLKASNILLDIDMNPKISDFGMARIFGADETEVTKRVVGTYGYMSPEYAMDGIFSVKSDVYSFGVLVLEIISGKKNRGVYQSTQHMNLLGYAWSLWMDGKGLDLVDESMSSLFLKAEILRFIKVGLLCVQERPEDRPTMSTILLMLGGENSMVPHPRQPGYVSIRGPCESDSSSGKKDSMTINNVSITMFEGR